MKTIEEKAKAYADKVFEPVIGGGTWGELKQAFADAYTAGATEALAGQWQTPDSLASCKEERVITRYRSKYKGLG